MCVYAGVMVCVCVVCVCVCVCVCVWMYYGVRVPGIPYSGKYLWERILRESVKIRIFAEIIIVCNSINQSISSMSVQSPMWEVAQVTNYQQNYSY